MKQISSLILRMILTILLAFSLLGTFGLGYGAYVTGLSVVCEKQVNKQQLPQKVHDSLQTYYEAQYNSTAIPAEVYMDVLTEDWIADQMGRILAGGYSQLKGAKTLLDESIVDFTSLEASITSYFDAYAASISYTKDEAYTEKLTETIADARKHIYEELDVFQFGTMASSGILAKTVKLHRLAIYGAAGSGVLSVVLLVVQMLLNRKRRGQIVYWVGCAGLAGGLMLAIPLAYLLSSRYFKGFSIKDPAVYSAFTGIMEHSTAFCMVIGFAAAALGLLGILIGIVRSQKQNEA